MGGSVILVNFCHNCLVLSGQLAYYDYNAMLLETVKYGYKDRFQSKLIFGR